MASPTFPAHFVANDLALDFINSAYGPGDQHVDVLTDDASVLGWLALAGTGVDDSVRAPKGLATLAHALREEAGTLMEAARKGGPFQATVVNQILDAGQPREQLQWELDAARAHVVHRRRDDSVASLLQPVAAAIARLLTEEDLAHVRQCEAHDCTLLFVDATKSQRRRWCSMALCGNRMKVAAFRSRQHG